MRLQTREGLYIGEIPFFNLQGEFRMNEPDEIRFKTSSQDLIKWVDPVNLLEAGVTEVKLIRNGVTIFLGPIWSITAGSDARQLSITANSIASYLKQRVVSVDTKFTKKQYSYGVWKLISDSQARPYGDLGITLGQNATTPSGSWSYARKSGTKIYDAIDKLATGNNGFDWVIDADRQLKMYYPRVQIDAKFNLEFGETGNIRRYSVQQMGSYAANEVWARGGGKIVSSTYSDTASKEKYGLRQYVPSDSALKSKTKVDSFARETLDLRKLPRAIPQMTVDSKRVNPFEGHVGYGYLIPTYINDGWVQFEGIMRCSGFQLTIGKHGQETFVLYVNDTREIENTDGVG